MREILGKDGKRSVAEDFPSRLSGPLPATSTTAGKGPGPFGMVSVPASVTRARGFSKRTSSSVEATGLFHPAGEHPNSQPHTRAIEAQAAEKRRGANVVTSSGGGRHQIWQLAMEDRHEVRKADRVKRSLLAGH